MPEQVSPQRREEIEKQERLERVADLLIRSPWTGIFFQDEAVNFMIPVSPKLGYKVALLNIN